MNEDEKKICRLLGTSEEDYIKARNSELSVDNKAIAGGSLNDYERKICKLLGVTEEEYIKAAAAARDWK